MAETSAFVLRSPIKTSIRTRVKKRTTSRATDAGKVTELSPMRELTPKHAKRIIRIPIGT
jgi:hypothetical protein